MKITFTVLLAFCLLSSLVSYAQGTGPGGVGTAATVALWLDASNQTGTNGSTITSWNDRSGNARNFTVGTGAVFNTNVVNGKSAFTFNGTTTYFERGYSAALNPANLSIFTVANVTSSTNYKSLITSRSTDEGYLIYSQPSNIGNVANDWEFWYGDGATAGYSITRSGIQSTGAWNIGTYTSTNAALNYYFNTTITANSPVPVNYAANTLAPVRVGAGVTEGTPGFFFTGQIAEVIIFNAVVNQVQRIIINNALAWKYGITLPAGNPLSGTEGTVRNSFSNDVAGIGRVTGTVLSTDGQGGMVRFFNTTNSLGNNEYFFWGHDGGALVATTADLPTAVPTIQARLTRKWLAYERNSTGGTGIDIGTTSISVDLTDVPGSKNVADLVLLVDRDGDGFSDEPATSVFTAATLAGNIVTFTNGTTGINLGDGFRFTVATTNTSRTPLPVQLSRFTAKVVDKKSVDLRWETATELNNAYFMVERSQDTNSWEEIEKIEGAGTSTTLHAYSTSDGQPYSGTSYYRLKQVDFDGQSSYSTVVATTLPRKLKVYPNPASGEIFIELDDDHDPRTIQMSDARGTVYGIFSEVRGGGKLRLDISGLRPGVYVLKIGSDSQKIVVLP